MSEQDCGPMAAPGPEHKRLEAFVGEFLAEVKLWMGPGDPLVSSGRMTNTMDVGGFFLRQSYQGDPNPGPFSSFEGRGFWGFNQVAQRYEGFWIDNASSIMQIETGTIDAAGKVWNMFGEVPDPRTGKSMKKRSVIKLESNDRHAMEMYFDHGGGEHKAMEIRYRRA